MNKRLLVIVAVFVVGFGIGYGITFLVVSGPGPTRSGPPVAAAAPDGAAPAPLPDVVEASADAGVAQAEDAAALDDNHSAAAAAPGEADATAGQDAAVAAAPDTAPPPEWWDRCKGRSCRVDFGRVRGGLSVRRGTLEHGEEVDWDERFSNADRIGVLPEGDDVWVELHAIGLKHGLPAAAHITWRGGDKPLTGVISLIIGEKIVRLAPDG